jgi:hypothetical protein
MEVKKHYWHTDTSTEQIVYKYMIKDNLCSEQRERNLL